MNRGQIWSRINNSTYFCLAYLLHYGFVITFFKTRACAFCTRLLHPLSTEASAASCFNPNLDFPTRIEQQKANSFLLCSHTAPYQTSVYVSILYFAPMLLAPAVLDLCCICIILNTWSPDKSQICCVILGSADIKADNILIG